MPELAGVFPGDSEMARRMRALDWSRTALGSPETWPTNLRVALNVCLTSRFPINVWWGPSLTLFYNDAYIAFLGRSKHPAALGQSGRDAWPEIWDTVGPMIDRASRDGVASWSEDIVMFFDRELRQEEVYVTFSFSPIFGQDGSTDGLFCACTETTEKIISNRRLRTLRQLGVDGAVAHDVADVCMAMGTVLSHNAHDVPFAALYLLDETSTDARLAMTSGLSKAGWQPAPVISRHATGAPWPFAEVIATKGPVDVVLDEAGISPVCGPWLDPTRQAVVLPVRAAVHDQLAGFLVAGVSTRRPFDAAYRAFFDLVAGHIASALAEARAYEEQRRRSEALAALDRAKTDFFSNVSHEFRTPLTLMLGPLEHELRYGQASSRLEIVHRSALRLLKLVNTLLDFSRIEAGRLEAAFEPTDLAALTVDLSSVFRSSIEGAGLRFRVDCPPLPEPVYVDHDMWEKVVLNLLSNAFKFTFEGEIAVTLRSANGRARLIVSDTGVGIPRPELPRVFDRFHRVRESRSRMHEGSGIGLALVRQLVTQHDGQIAVDSVVGRGTAFTVTLPLGSAHLPADRTAGIPRHSADSSRFRRAAFRDESELWLADTAPGGTPGSDATEAVPPERTGRGRILYADDNADLRHYVTGLLASDYDVLAVRNGEEALAVIYQGLPDLVLADVMMPRLDGCQLLARLRGNPVTAGLPVILLSARAGEEARVDALDRGADDYLIKPFGARELRARVHAHLELTKARRAGEDKVKALFHRLVHAQEDERRRIARDIHDQLGQQITALRMSLEAVVTKVGDPALAAQAERTQQLAEELDRSIDFLTWDLRPAALDQIGLPAALRHLVTGWSQRFGITAEFDALGVHGLRISDDVESNLYRLTQEALHNVVKHAKANHVAVLLEQRAGQLRLMIEDNGCGLRPDDSREPAQGALGLVSMRERAALIGGRLEIDSSPGAGTTIFVRVPLGGRGGTVTGTNAGRR